MINVRYRASVSGDRSTGAMFSNQYRFRRRRALTPEASPEGWGSVELDKGERKIERLCFDFVAKNPFPLRYYAAPLRPSLHREASRNSGAGATAPGA